MPRSALPQNYITNEGTLLESFEDVNEWSVGSDSDGTVQNNSVNYKTGTQSLRFSVTNGYVLAIKSISEVINPRTMHLWVYLHSELATVAHVEVQFTSTDFTKRFIGTFNTDTCLLEGWNLLSIHRDEWTCQGGESWDNTMTQLKVLLFGITGKYAEVSVDSLRYNQENLARCMIHFDDARDSAYSQAYNYMHPLGLKGTIYVISDSIDTAGYMTKANLDTVYSNGWSFGNHTIDHSHLTDLTQAEAEVKISECTDWLIANGYPRAAYHLAYPLGLYNDDVLAAVDATGLLTARTSYVGIHPTPVGDFRLLQIREVSSSKTLADAKAYIDKAIKKDMTLILLFHEIVTSPSISTQWSITDFQALMDYIAARRIQCVTIDEWYKGLTNPRYKALSLSRIEID